MRGFEYDPKINPKAKVFHKPTPFPPDKRKWVQKEMRKLESSGVVRRVPTCRCAANVVLVENGQQGQDFRMCCNFVDLNPHTAAVHYPIPEPAALVDESARADVWSTIDIKACFHNFPVAHSAQEYLGITT